MELRYENLKNKPKAFRAFTGLDVEEFQILLQAFTLAWERYIQQHYLSSEAREARQRDYGGGRKAKLATCEEKLLFILVYFKTYPLQEVLAFHFDMSQSQACQWIYKIELVAITVIIRLVSLMQHLDTKFRFVILGIHHSLYFLESLNFFNFSV